MFQVPNEIRLIHFQLLHRKLMRAQQAEHQPQAVLLEMVMETEQVEEHQLLLEVAMIVQYQDKEAQRLLPLHLVPVRLNLEALGLVDKTNR